MTKQLSERTTALLPQLIQQLGINVPIYKVEETKTLIRFYLYGRTKPLVVRKPKAESPPPRTRPGGE